MNYYIQPSVFYIYDPESLFFCYYYFCFENFTYVLLQVYDVFAILS